MPVSGIQGSGAPTCSQSVASSPRFARVWAMPSRDTFTVRPIGEFVQRYLAKSKVSVDPFARNCEWATHRNDADESTKATWHGDAIHWLDKLAREGVTADLAILDPPYSPRQISEHYKAFGWSPTTIDTQNGALYSLMRQRLLPILTHDAIVLSFGWNSAGMGKGWRQLEILLVAHGGAHNDTICLAEQRA